MSDPTDPPEDSASRLLREFQLKIANLPTAKLALDMAESPTARLAREMALAQRLELTGAVAAATKVFADLKPLQVDTVVTQALAQLKPMPIDAGVAKALYCLRDGDRQYGCRFCFHHRDGIGCHRW